MRCLFFVFSHLRLVLSWPLLSIRRPLCKPSCTALLLGATRQVVAAASAILRTHRGDQRGDGLHLSMQETFKGVAQDFCGHEVGISQVVKHLRLNEHAELAKAVTAQHKCRNLAAHSAGDLDVRVRLAFGKTFIKKDPLVDNDPWKQKVAVKNVDHVVKETSNNDVAAEPSEIVVAPACGTWGALVLRLLVANTGRHSSAACTKKKKETSQLKLMQTPNLPSLMFRRSATRWMF